jgi:hypothetical protein
MTTENEIKEMQRIMLQQKKLQEEKDRLDAQNNKSKRILEEEQRVLNNKLYAIKVEKDLQRLVDDGYTDEFFNNVIKDIEDNELTQNGIVECWAERGGRSYSIWHQSWPAGPFCGYRSQYSTIAELSDEELKSRRQKNPQYDINNILYMLGNQKKRYTITKGKFKDYLLTTQNHFYNKDYITLYYPSSIKNFWNLI